jgi:enoyl-CoA hydratase
MVSLEKEYKMVKFSQRDRVGLITMNCPPVNALCDQLVSELVEVCQTLSRKPEIGAIVICSEGKHFSAGANLKEMKDHTWVSAYDSQLLEHWRGVSNTKIPVIAAVHGMALGGGCELAMSCDIIYCAKGAKFGQPEITVGTIPGCGGTQRLIREVGKGRAMEMCLTGDMMGDEEALRRGLVARVFEADALVTEAVAWGNKIAAHSKTLSCMAKDAVNAAYEMPLKQGLDYEKRMFYGTFGTPDQKEGMTAFAEKRKPDWKQFHK